MAKDPFGRPLDTQGPVIVPPGDVARLAAQRDRDDAATEYAMSELDATDISDLEELDKLGEDAPSMTKAKADYVDVWDNGATQCQCCSMFVAGGRCTLVKGPIKPGGHCKHFDPD